jgi:hypothetical protein
MDQWLQRPALTLLTTTMDLAEVITRVLLARNEIDGSPVDGDV